MSDHPTTDHLAECFSKLKDLESIPPGSQADLHLRDELWARGLYGPENSPKNADLQHPLYIELFTLRLPQRYPEFCQGQPQLIADSTYNINNRMKSALGNFDADFFKGIASTMRAIKKAEEAPPEFTRTDRAAVRAFLQFYSVNKRLPTVAEWKDATTEILNHGDQYLDPQEWSRLKKRFSMASLNPGPERRGRKPDHLGDSPDPHVRRSRRES